MTNHTTKSTGAPIQEAPPVVDLKSFGFNGGDAGSALHRHFSYATRKHSKTDICRPGYFEAAKEFGLKLWDIIDCTVGDDPGTAIEVRLRVIDMGRGHLDKKTMRGKSDYVPLTIAVSRQTDFTPVRHDGLQTDEAA